MRAVGHLDDRVDAEAGQHGAVGVPPQHLGVDDLLDRHDRLPRGLGEDPEVGPDDRRLDLDVAVLVGAVGVDERDVGDERAARDERLARERVLEGLEVLVHVDQVGPEQAPGRQRRQVPGARGEPGVERRLRELLDPDAPLLDGLPVLLAEAEGLHRDRGPDEAVDRARRREPVDGHPADEADEAETALLLADQLADERHRRGLGGHVLEGDDVPVGDEADRLLERPHLVMPTLTISSPPWISTSWPVM